MSVVLRTYDFVGIAPEKVNTHFVRASFFFERDKFLFISLNYTTASYRNNNILFVKHYLSQTPNRFFHLTPLFIYVSTISIQKISYPNCYGLSRRFNYLLNFQNLYIKDILLIINSCLGGLKKLLCDCRLQG